MHLYQKNKNRKPPRSCQICKNSGNTLFNFTCSRKNKVQYLLPVSHEQKFRSAFTWEAPDHPLYRHTAEPVVPMWTSYFTVDGAHRALPCSPFRSWLSLPLPVPGGLVPAKRNDLEADSSKQENEKVPN